VYDPSTHVISQRKAEEASPISEWLGGQSFVVSPLRRHEWTSGYLFLGASRPDAFGMEDAVFLLQLADQVMPVLQHIRLVDHLASDAANEERRRIARSVHDRVIQPYIGLHIGLQAVHQLVQSAARENACDTEDERFKKAVAAIEHLRSMASEGVEELRQYVYGLRSARAQGEVLVDALLRYAAKFETATGIHVTIIDQLTGMELNDRLAAEIFQVAAEALSNVHRHTTATDVTLSIDGASNGCVVMRVENEGRRDEKVLNFIPRSIAEHAEALGGRTEISNINGRTIVQMEIPL
jgi:signal transduction histidine kinase